MVVAGPGVVTVEIRLMSGRELNSSQQKVAPTSGSIFQLAVLPDPPPGSYRVLARDLTRRVIDTADYSSVGR